MRKRVLESGLVEVSEPPLPLFSRARINTSDCQSETREIPKSSSQLTFRGDSERAVTCAAAGSPKHVWQKVLSTTRMPTYLARSARERNVPFPFTEEFFVRVQKLLRPSVNFGLFGVN